MHVRQRKCFVKIRHGKEKIGCALEKLCDAEVWQGQAKCCDGVV